MVTISNKVNTMCIIFAASLSVVDWTEPTCNSLAQMNLQTFSRVDPTRLKKQLKALGNLGMSARDLDFLDVSTLQKLLEAKEWVPEAVQLLNNVTEDMYGSMDRGHGGEGAQTFGRSTWTESMVEKARKHLLKGKKLGLHEDGAYKNLAFEVEIQESVRITLGSNKTLYSKFYQDGGYSFLRGFKHQKKDKLRSGRKVVLSIDMQEPSIPGGDKIKCFKLLGTVNEQGDIKYRTPEGEQYLCTGGHWLRGDITKDVKEAKEAKDYICVGKNIGDFMNIPRQTLKNTGDGYAVAQCNAFCEKDGKDWKYAEISGERVPFFRPGQERYVPFICKCCYDREEYRRESITEGYYSLHAFAELNVR